MKSGRITTPEAQHFLAAIVASEPQKIEEERYYEPEASSPEEWRERHLDDRCRVAAGQLVAGRGRAAALLKEDHARLMKDGFSTHDMIRISREIESLQTTVSSEEYTAESKRLAFEHLGRSSCEGAHLRTVTALRIAAQVEALKVSDRIEKPLSFVRLDPSEIAACLCKTEPQETPPVPAEPERPGTPSQYDDALDFVIENYIGSLDDKTADNAKKKTIQKDIRQKRSVLSQFSEATGAKRLSDLMQRDFGAYIDTLQKIPKNHGKSAADRALTLHELVERGENLPADKVGLSDTTVNRNVTILSGFLKYARARGMRPGEPIEFTDLRRSDRRDPRDARLAFSDDDVRKIAAHPVWSSDFATRRDSGIGEKGGLYWGPIIADLSGTRREEILGMKLDDVITDHEIPYFKIQRNSNRQLKNLSSERVIPVHSRLIELGLLDHIATLRQQGETNLFPDLQPKKALGSFGDVFYKQWKPALDTQLEERAERRTFHSFRHRVISTLRHDTSVAESFVKDLVGHQHNSETDRRYRKTDEYLDQILPNLKAIVEKLPGHLWK